MRVLLINAPYQFSDPIAHRTELLGLEYLGSSLRETGHEVFIYDPTMSKPNQLPNGLYYYGTTYADMYNKIKSYRPDCVGISCHYSYASKEAFKLAEIVKNINSDIVVVMGGLFISVFNEKALIECDAIDYCLIGESEMSFPDLLLNISLKTKKLDEVDGLIYRTGNKILKNNKCKYIDELDSLPFPARDMVDIASYMRVSETRRLYGLGTKPTLSLLTSRSCPYRCSFCNMKLVHGPRWRKRTPENVVNELDEIINKYKAEHVFIMDDNFTFKPDRTKSICERIIEKGYKFRWNTPNGISVKRVDEEMAYLMKRAGCANVCIAIESGSEYIRREIMNKKISNSEIENAVKCFKKANIPVVGFLILGIPGEEEEHFNETLKFVTSLTLTSIVVSFATPFHGTKLHEDLIRQGIIDENFTIGIDDLNHPVYSTNSFTKDVLVKRKKILKDFFPSLAILYELEVKNEQYL
ncbi:radical SAM protein [Deltaproteobacteria bacterium]|nr:radical SAM protein [Deltaproteobacteria bacterium]